MRYMILLVTLLKIGSLKTETIDFTRKNGQMDMMFPPLDQSKKKDIPSHPANKLVDGYNNQHTWNEIDKYQPYDIRKIFNPNDNEEYEAEDMEIPEDQFKSIEQLDDVQSMYLFNYLLKLLQRPGAWEAPLVLIKDSQDNLEDRAYSSELDGLHGIAKRSRYYRRYPWKRQNKSYNNMDYDPYCTPSKQDVFRLLVALHDARQGNKSRSVNFCNRRRPASAVYTNIRFIGRRRK